MKDFTLAGVAERIVHPTLLCDDERNRLATLEPPGSSCRRKGQDVEGFTAEEGGVEHCQVDTCQVGTDYICDWLGARLS